MHQLQTVAFAWSGAFLFFELMAAQSGSTSNSEESSLHPPAPKITNRRKCHFDTKKTKEFRRIERSSKELKFNSGVESCHDSSFSEKLLRSARKLPYCH